MALALFLWGFFFKIPQMIKCVYMASSPRDLCSRPHIFWLFCSVAFVPARLVGSKHSLAYFQPVFSLFFSGPWSDREVVQAKKQANALDRLPPTHSYLGQYRPDGS